MTARWPFLGYATAVVVLVVLLAVDPAGAQPTQIDDMIEGPALQGGDEPTIAERYPVTSYRYPFHGEGISVGSRSNELLDQTLNAIASLLILAAGLLAQAASTIVQWAFDPATTSWLLDGVEATVSALGDSLYGQAVLVMVFIGILWLAWHGLMHRRATTALQGGIWMVAILALGVAFFAQPRWFIETPHQLTTELSAGMFGAVATVGTDTAGGSYHGTQPPTFSSTPAVNAQRRLEDQLWRVMVYEPWKTSTFANDQLANEFAEPLLADRSTDNVQAIYEEIELDELGGEADAEFFAGREPLDRLIASLLTVLAALPIAITMIVLGTALIVLQFAFVILSLLAPIFLLIGLHPGGGRNAMLRWLDMWLGTLVKRVAITALISVLVALFAFAAANLTQQGWYLTVLLTTLVCVAALIYRKTITELIASAAGSIGSGAEGQREHAARSHPGRTTARVSGRATRAVKHLGIGAAAGRTSHALRQQRDPEGDRATARDGARAPAGRRSPEENDRESRTATSNEPEHGTTAAHANGEPNPERRRRGRAGTAAPQLRPVTDERAETDPTSDEDDEAPPQPAIRSADHATARGQGDQDNESARRSPSSSAAVAPGSRRPRGTEPADESDRSDDEHAGRSRSTPANPSSGRRRPRGTDPVEADRSPDPTPNRVERSQTARREEQPSSGRPPAEDGDTRAAQPLGARPTEHEPSNHDRPTPRRSSRSAS